MSAYNSSFQDPFEYVRFDIQDGDCVVIRVRDILPFLGSLLGKTINMPFSGRGIVIGVRGVEAPHFDNMRAHAIVIVRERNGEFATREIHWQNVFAYNYHLYEPTAPKTKIALPSERAIDLRGLMNG